MSMKGKALVGLILSFVLAALFSSVVQAKSASGVRSVSYEVMAKSGKEPATTEVYLNPTQGWINSGIFLKEGDLVNITADGLVDPGVRLSRGPDGQGRDPLKEMVRDCNYMALLGRIGDASPFCVGSAGTFEVIEGGNLGFHVNELDSLRFDDLGHFNITVRVVSVDSPDKKSPALTAVMDLAAINVPEDEAQVLSITIRGQLGATGNYIVVDQGQVEAAAKRKKIKKEDMANPATAAAIARDVGAQKAVVGQIGRIGDSYTISLQLVDSLSGVTEKTVSEVHKCGKGELPEKLAEAVKKL